MNNKLQYFEELEGSYVTIITEGNIPIKGFIDDISKDGFLILSFEGQPKRYVNVEEILYFTQT